MKQVDVTVVMLKDSLRITPAVKSTTAAVAKPASTTKISQQDVLKQRAKTLQKQLETLRAKTSADMVKSFKNIHLLSSINYFLLASCDE
jgi:predicted metal-dependent hydrolase